MSRLNSPALPASSSSTGTSATATSSDLFHRYFHRVSLSFPVELCGFHQGDAVSSAFIARVSHFIDALGDEVDAESGLLRAIQRRAEETVDGSNGSPR